MDEKILVWVVDDDRSIRWVLETALKREGCIVTSFSSADGILDLMCKDMPDVLITDIRRLTEAVSATSGDCDDRAL